MDTDHAAERKKQSRVSKASVHHVDRARCEVGGIGIGIAGRIQARCDGPRSVLARATLIGHFPRETTQLHCGHSVLISTLFCLMGLTIFDRLPWIFKNWNRIRVFSRLVGPWSISARHCLSQAKSHEMHLCYLTSGNLVTLERLIDSMNINPMSINNRLGKVLNHLSALRPR